MLGAGLSLNNDKITTGLPIYYYGFLIVLGAENFFNPNFQVPALIRVPFPDPNCKIWATASILKLKRFEFNLCRLI
ncbi:hypothetical protein M0R45_035121 [Rubus argutus]|uniref:Uncharacterized protein n=1 Tax=Rubus argutus TaxID=59490 RepID=A0AAW1VXI4_RUBAR